MFGEKKTAGHTCPPGLKPGHQRREIYSITQPVAGGRSYLFNATASNMAGKIIPINEGFNMKIIYYIYI